MLDNCNHLTEEEKPQCWSMAAVPCTVPAVPAVPAVLPLHAAVHRIHPGNKQILPVPSLAMANQPFPVCAEEQTPSRAGKQLRPKERSKGLCR